MNVKKGDLAFIVNDRNAGAIVEVGDASDLSVIGASYPCWNVRSCGSPLKFWHTVAIDGVIVKQTEVLSAHGICPDENLRAIRGELNEALRETFDQAGEPVAA